MGEKASSQDEQNKDQGNVLEKVFGHKMCVVTKRRQSVDIDNLGDILYDPVQIKFEGIYMFGGVYGESQLKERRVNN